MIEQAKFIIYRKYKNLFGFFPGRLKYAKVGKLTLWVPVPKLVEVIP